MGSRKQREKNKKIASVPITTLQKSEKKQFDNNLPQAPIYTIAFMVLGIIVLSFVFTIILNTVISDICLSRDSSLGSNNEALLEATKKFILENQIYSIVQKMLINISGILVMMMFFYRLEKNELPVIGFKKTKETRFQILIGLGLSFVAVLVAYNLIVSMGFTELEGTYLFDKMQLIWTLDIILMTMFEEIFFRGYIIYKLKGKSENIAIIVSTLLFVLYKGVPSTSPATYFTFAAMGIMLAIASLKLKSIWFAVSFRFMWTFSAAIIFSVYSGIVPGILINSGVAENLLSGNKFGFENGFIATAVLIGCHFAIQKIISMKQKPKPRRIHSDGTIH